MQTIFTVKHTRNEKKAENLRFHWSLCPLFRTKHLAAPQGWMGSPHLQQSLNQTRLTSELWLLLLSTSGVLPQRCVQAQGDLLSISHSGRLQQVSSLTILPVTVDKHKDIPSCMMLPPPCFTVVMVFSAGWQGLKQTWCCLWWTKSSALFSFDHKFPTVFCFSISPFCPSSTRTSSVQRIKLFLNRSAQHRRSAPLHQGYYWPLGCFSGLSPSHAVCEFQWTTLSWPVCCDETIFSFPVIDFMMLRGMFRVQRFVNKPWFIVLHNVVSGVCGSCCHRVVVEEVVLDHHNTSYMTLFIAHR